MSVPHIGPMELVVILALALIIFGPGKLPQVGKALGEGIREFRSSLAGKGREDEEKPGQAPRA